MRGFTLIETLIYLALFGIIMGGISVTTYALIEASGRNQTQIIVQGEGNFLLGKFDWALTGASSINVTSTNLTISKYAGISPLVFNFNAGNLQLTEGTGPPTSLNSSTVQMTSLAFSDIPAANGKPEGVTTSFTLKDIVPNGAAITRDFQITKYLRK